MNDGADARVGAAAAVVDEAADGTTNPGPAIRIRGLSHRYPKASRAAVEGLDLEVRRGEALALLGPNGGGKTTTFRILATLLRASDDGGRVEVMGHDVRRDAAGARRAIGVVFQSPSLDVKLTARENLAVQARMYGLPRREVARRVDAGLEQFHLRDRQNEKVEGFSGGMRRKLEIAKALLHRPSLLLMDEPATGLDPAARRELWDHLLELRRQRGLTIAWTTHLMDEAERADRVAVLVDGRVVGVDSPAQLKAGEGRSVVSVQPQDPADLAEVRATLERELGPWPDGSSPVVIDQEVRFDHAAGPAVVVRVAELLPGKLRRVAVGEPTLEDAYLRLTAGRRPAEVAAS